MNKKTAKIILKGEDWKFEKNYFLQEEFALNADDPKIRQCIEDARDCLRITPDDEQIKCSLVNK